MEDVTTIGHGENNRSVKWIIFFFKDRSKEPHKRKKKRSVMLEIVDGNWKLGLGLGAGTWRVNERLENAKRK